VDYGTGVQAALAISAALFQRNITGRGQHIDVAMLDCALMLMNAHVVDTIVEGRAPEPHGNEHPSYAGYRTYQTANGTLMVGAYTNSQYARLLEVLGESVRAQEVLSGTRCEIRAACDQDAVVIAEHLAKKPAAEWEVVLNAVHVPAARVRRIEETLEEPQIASRTVLGKCEGVQTPLPVAGYSYAHGTPSLDRPPPRYGEHTDEVLVELGFSMRQIANMHREGAVK